ncbi:class I SAM-dependent methyltransferase [Stappia sp.]|uniref:class I SAM-dependent methyltransferase n=1 Tax=Stappia sp. TaxID=1870903 RepID=UPI003A9A4670
MFNAKRVFALMHEQTIDGMPLNDIVGGGNARDVGEEWAAFLANQGFLRGGARILDIGCGCGRLAAALADSRPDVDYVGIDIVPGLIDFCRKNITESVPSFNFYVVQQESSLYKSFIEDHDIPVFTDDTFKDGYFDLVIATSLFTHTRRDTTQAYFSMANRLLRAGGTMLFSCFAMDEHAQKAIHNRSTHPFQSGKVETASDGLVEDRYNGELSAIGYPAAMLEEMLDAAGFDGIAGFYRGFWRGSAGHSFQDVVQAPKALDVPHDFDGSAYLKRHPDVANGGMAPLFHYKIYGIKERRPLR